MYINYMIHSQMWIVIQKIYSPTVLGLVNGILMQGHAYVGQRCAIQCDAANRCCFYIVFYKVHASTDRKGERIRKGWAPAAAALSENDAFAAKQHSKNDHQLEQWLSVSPSNGSRLRGSSRTQYAYAIVVMPHVLWDGTDRVYKHHQASACHVWHERDITRHERNTND